MFNTMFIREGIQLFNCTSKASQKNWSFIDIDSWNTHISYTHTHTPCKGDGEKNRYFYMGKSMSSMLSKVRRFLKLTEKLRQSASIYWVCGPNWSSVKCFPHEMYDSLWWKLFNNTSPRLTLFYFPPGYPLTCCHLVHFGNK